MAEIRPDDCRIYHEVELVGAELGSGFVNTAEFKVIKYNEAMINDKVG